MAHEFIDGKYADQEKQVQLGRSLNLKLLSNMQQIVDAPTRPSADAESQPRPLLGVFPSLFLSQRQPFSILHPASSSLQSTPSIRVYLEIFFGNIPTFVT